MSTTEVYDALKEAGASEEKARKAAEALTNYDARLNKIEDDRSYCSYSHEATSPGQN